MLTLLMLGRGGWGGWCKPFLVLSFSLSNAGQFGLSQDEQKSYFRTNFVLQKVVFVSQRCSGEPSKKNYKIMFLLNLRGERGPDPRCGKVWQPDNLAARNFLKNQALTKIF